MIVYHHLPELNRRIPESCCLIILGIIIGVLVEYVYIRGAAGEVETLRNIG